MFKPFYWTLLVCLLFPCSNLSAEEQEALSVTVTGERISDESAREVSRRRVETSDVAAMLDTLPGADVSGAGGISGLPVVRGMNDDRLKIEANGAVVTSACPNHMNPPLSYVDPFSVQGFEVEGPASSIVGGGDSTGSRLEVISPDLEFAGSGETFWKGRAASFYRSNDVGLSESLSLSAGNESQSVAYAGGFSQAESYKDGNGDRVRSTMYRVINHSLRAAARTDIHYFNLNATLQSIPYEGYVNQYMDMVDNQGILLSLKDSMKFDWGKLDLGVYWQDIEHEMDFFSHEKTGKMPMLTDTTDLGYHLRVEVPVNEDHILRAGHELRHLSLDDRWPPVMDSMMMSPLEYVNINHATRRLIDHYLEWEYRAQKNLSTIFGGRHSYVTADTGDVQPYNTGGMVGVPNLEAAIAFNESDHSYSDQNFDLKAGLKADLDMGAFVDFGYARKTRSPNLYELYAWGRGDMAAAMTGWFGDASGYVGNLELQAEVAHTISSSFGWEEASGRSWSFEVTPYFSYVENFIDVDVIRSFNPRMSMDETRNILQFANHDARIGGVDVTGSVGLWSDGALGSGRLRGQLGWTRGERVDGGDLYHMMPLNGSLRLEQEFEDWSNGFELQLVSRKSMVDELRHEPETPGYALLGLYSSYRWENLRLDFSITNLLDRYHSLPLGGVDYADWKADGAMGQMGAVAGRGRSFNLGLSIEF